MKKKIFKKYIAPLFDNKGETLIEMVISLSLFVMTITMLVTVFQSSNLGLATNVETKRTIYAKEEMAMKKENLESKGNKTITYSYTVGDNTYQGTFDTELDHVKDSVFYIYR